MLYHEMVVGKDKNNDLQSMVISVEGEKLRSPRC